MSSKQESKQETTYDPAYMARINQNYDRTKSIADTPFQPFTGERVAGFTPTQIQSQGVLAGIANDPSYANNNASIAGGVKSIISNPITAATYDPTTLANTDLTPYLNPFTDNVVNTTLADLAHARDVQGVKDRQSATNAGSFQGAGTRFGVQNAQTTDDYLRNVAGTSANLRANAFNNAQTAALADVATRNNAGQFNATARNNANQFNVNTGLNGAGILSGLNNNSLDIATRQGGILAAVGDQQQALQQAKDSAAYEEFLRQINDPFLKQQLLNQSLSTFPVQATTTNTTSTSPGVGGIFGGIASLGTGILGMGTNSIGGKILGYS